ncbi:hypothetical protein [uncultured Flavonifractor sp.]|uniref:hypothetical protein n=1 Tax=uncultured Flavonifractor sp. TaxID=1193534 RepID=UPI00259A75DD|nr:hypothetical protein [uncultured Flavonifractor sp.]
MKKDTLLLAREELLKLDQTVRDCSDRLAELSPLDLETARLRAAIMEANARVRTVLDNM